MKQKIINIVLILFFLAGLSITLYPVVSDWYISHHQGQVVDNYDKKAAEMSQKEINDALEKAREYNRELLGNVVLTDPFDPDAVKKQNEENGLNILDPEQEERQKEWLDGRLEDESNASEVWDIFHAIGKASKQMQARKLFDYNIVLIGFMGAGKTSISEYLKTLFAMDVIEMDQIIAEREGMSIPDIFEVHGEQYFRDLETNLLIEMQSRKNVVISCGGGTPLRECNVVEMKKNGRVVLLTASPETIFDRVKDSHDRPVIENNKNVPFIADLMEKRRAKYEAAADIVINTDGKSIIEVCEELVQKLLAMDENDK